MTEIVWEEPPPRDNQTKSKHFEMAAALRSNPGRWAKVGTGGPSMQNSIKLGRLAAYRPAGSFEAAARNSRTVNGRSTKVYDIYARYIGDGST